MKKGFLFKFVRSVGVLAAALGVAVFLFVIKSEPERIEDIKAVPVVEVIVAQPEILVMKVEAFGTVTPRQSLKIAAEVPGRVVFLHPFFAEGKFVKKGDTLIRIDPRSYRLEMESSEVMVKQAEIDMERLHQDIENLKSDTVLARANAQLSDKDLKRVMALSREEFASKVSLDKAEQRDIESRMRLQGFENSLLVTNTAMKQKKAALAMARINLERAELALEKTEIKAEFSGYILQKTVEAGEFVSVGQTLGSMYLQGELDVEVGVPIEMMKWLEPVFEKGIMPDAEISMTGPGADRTWKARVARLKALIDDKTRTLPMVLEIEFHKNTGETILGLRPGSFVRCSINGAVYDRVFVLPRHLLKSGDILFTVDLQQLVVKQVTVLRKFQEQVYILGGLEPGDKIVSSPLPGAVAGMRVIEKDSPGQAGQ